MEYCVEDILEKPSFLEEKRGPMRSKENLDRFLRTISAKLSFSSATSSG